ncbi:MAG: helix-turn-helix domain-containing protein [Opitutaceae bacterium]|nr:helix-turn-helix domain-containing protein [Opitutaceae bacterium]
MNQSLIEYREPIGFQVVCHHWPSLMDHPHTHSEIEINFLTAGSLTYLHGGQIVTVDAGKMAVFWGGVPHQTIQSSVQTEGFLITLPLAWFLQWAVSSDFCDRLLSGELMIDSSQVNLDQENLNRWATDYSSADKELRSALLLELEARLIRFATVARIEKKDQRMKSPAISATQVERVSRFIAMNFREPLTLDKIAQAVVLHPKYLTQVFKKHCHLNVWEYVLRLRVSHAQRLLVQTDMNIIDVAMDSGFESLGPFYNAFHRYGPGVKPARYREQFQAH